MKLKHKILVDEGKFEIENPTYSNHRYLCWASIIYNWLTGRQENFIDAIMFRIYKKSGTFEDVEIWMSTWRRKCFGIYVNSKKIEDDRSSTSRDNYNWGDQMKYKHGKLLESVFVRIQSSNYYQLFPSCKTTGIYASILVNQYISYAKNHGDIQSQSPPFFKAEGKYHVLDTDIRIFAIIKNLNLIDIEFEVIGLSGHNGYIEFYYNEKKTHRDN